LSAREKRLDLDQGANAAVIESGGYEEPDSMIIGSLSPNHRMIGASLKAIALGTIVLVAASMPAHADKGSVKVVFGKISFGVGFGGGSGVLTFHGKKYLFNVSGLSWGATAGLTTSQLVGTVLNLSRVEDFPGAYAATGVGVAAAVGVGRVRLQNAKGVVLILHGPKFGAEVSANYANVEITMKGMGRVAQ